MKRLTTYLKMMAVALTATLALVACNDDEGGPKAPLAFFTSAPDADNSQLIIFTNETENADSYVWDFGDGSATSTEVNPSHEYANPGPYTVTLTATNAGGDDVYSDDITVTSSAGVEVVVDGDMSNPDAWTYTALNAAVASTFTFADGAVTITNGNVVNQSNGVIYQEIEVNAGDYLLSMDVTNDGTQVQTWLEIYVGSIIPESGADYSDGGMLSGISAWDCPQANTNVDIITVGCKGTADVANGGNGIVNFTEGGTKYLVIKSGSWDGNLTTGYVIDNVSLISQ